MHVRPRLNAFSGLVGALVLLLFGAAVHAETRVALVIGNGAYKNTAKLANPHNDATDVAAALKRLGFSTIVGLDLDKAGMDDIEIRFTRATRGADMAMVYYSGHAIQYAGTNYLLPVDAEIKDSADLRRLTKVDDIVADLQQAKDLRILVLDSCRDNPLADELKRSLGERSASVQRGLARLGGSQGMIVAYSTQAGQTANDGSGRNSPYTAAFLKQIETPQEISTVFKRVSLEVYEKSDNRQLPELSLSLFKDYYLRGAGDVGKAVVASPSMPTTAEPEPDSPKPPAFAVTAPAPSGTAEPKPEGPKPPVGVLAALAPPDQTKTYQSDRPSAPPERVVPTEVMENSTIYGILGDIDDRWNEVFQASGKSYTKPQIVPFSSIDGERCGMAQGQFGPFYCPSDKQIFLDAGFLQEVATRFHGCSGNACKFTAAYILAHEAGHHIQNLLGILPKVTAVQQQSSKTESDALQVKVELQADCLSGVWANLEAKKRPGFLEAGDIDAALTAASAIGGDTLQRLATAQVVPDSFTYGSAEQRKHWFMTGYQQGTVQACNTFAPGAL